jgi:hypothetical protein
MGRAKSVVTKECLIKTIDLLGKAMHVNHLKKEYHLKQRDDLIRQLVAYMTLPTNSSKDNKQPNHGEVTNQIRLNATNAITTLVYVCIWLLL